MSPLIRLLFIIVFVCTIGCDNSDQDMVFYDCNLQNVCEESQSGDFLSMEECVEECSSLSEGTRVTVFLYENCPIAQYMCGPLRNAYRYFCDTLGVNILFQGFSPNASSTVQSLINFQTIYDIPFPISLDYNLSQSQPGPNTQYYQPIVTPEVFVEHNNNLIYRGMIDNSYEELGQWSPPTNHYLLSVLESIVNQEEVDYFETQAVGCIINY